MQQVLLQIGQYLADKKDWKKQFDAIDNLRAINKFYSSEVNHIFEDFGMSIVELLLFNRTSTQKNCILLLTEAINHADKVNLLPEVIIKVVPILFNMCFSERGIIKT